MKSWINYRLLPPPSFPAFRQAGSPFLRGRIKGEGLEYPFPNSSSFQEGRISPTPPPPQRGGGLRRGQ